MSAIIVSYFTSSSFIQVVSGRDPLTTARIAQRRKSVVDMISAALFTTTTRERCQTEGTPKVNTLLPWRTILAVLLCSIVGCNLSFAQILPGISGAANVDQGQYMPQTTPSFQMQVSNQTQGQSPVLGSIPVGKPTAETLPLSLRDAIDRGLHQNLALFLGVQGTRAARAEQLRSLSDLLPNVSARTTETVQQINLAAEGLPTNLFPGLAPIVGPFNTFDARAAYSQRLFDWKAIQNTRSAGEDVKAAQLSYKDARELVVLVVTNLYLQVVAGGSRLESARAQVETARAVYQQAVDRERTGVAARIDVVRAQVEMQAQQQRLLSVENELEKQKLTLARAIGLPVGQRFETIEAVPYGPLPPVTFEQALADAYRNRPDYLQAQALVRSADLARSAAVAGRFPTVHFDGDYGTIGPVAGEFARHFHSSYLSADPNFSRWSGSRRRAAAGRNAPRAAGPGGRPAQSHRKRDTDRVPGYKYGGPAG